MKLSPLRVLKKIFTRPGSRSSKRKKTAMAEKTRKETQKTQAETNREQANEIKDDGFSPDPEVARQVGGDRAADDTKSDPQADAK